MSKSKKSGAHNSGTMSVKTGKGGTKDGQKGGKGGKGC